MFARLACLALCFGLCLPAAVQAEDLRLAKDLKLERVVVVMRHGVRPPTKTPPLPVKFTTRTWPQWDVPAGWLTAHGEQAVARLATFDGRTYAAVTGTGCPDQNRVRVIADTDQRTLKTASVYADTLFPGCGVPVENVGDGKSDPRFSPFDNGMPFSPEIAEQAVTQALPAGGLAALDAANHDRLALLSRLLDCRTAACDLTAMPTQLVTREGRTKITGGLDTASTLAQILLLEYTDGKPMAEVGWGQVTAADITDLSSLHALEFALVARPAAVANAGAAPLLAEVDRALFDAKGAAYTVLVGHDSNLAYIGGKLDLHWQAAGFATDDPAPGGALIFELWRDAAGKAVVQVRYRAQSLDEIRTLSDMAASDSQVLTVSACGGDTCDGSAFRRLIAPAAR